MKKNPPAQATTTEESGTVHDMELVRRFVGGDETAFAEIMGRYQAKIFAVAQGLLRNCADAEEITQDTFLRAYRNLARFRGDSSLSTWLHRIAVNLARNRYWYFFRRRRHLTVSFDTPIGEDGGGTLADLFSADAADPSQECSREEFGTVVAAAMARLDRPHREILALRNLQNRSYDEIARQLGINPGTVKSRIARARERLRAQIAVACPEFKPDTDPTEWFEPARGPASLAPVCA